MVADHSFEAPATKCSNLEKLKSETKAHLYDEMVRVRFEDSEKVFNVHRGLICHYSEYFRGAFKGRFVEGKSGEATLPKNELQAFESVFSWLYTGSLFDDRRADEGNDPEDGKSLEVLCKALGIYLFADMRGAPALKNAAIDVVIDDFIQRRCLHPVAIKQIYENTASTSDCLRKFWVDALVSMDAAKFFAEESREKFPHDFLFDICRIIIGDGARTERLKSREHWKEVNKCDYHDHTDINATPKLLSARTW